MKTFILSFVLFYVSILTINAQGKKEIHIKTSAQCRMCKDIIEKALSYEKGIYSSNLDINTKVVTVVYNPKKNNPDKIRLTISKIGFQADDLKADPIAYEALPPCCKLSEEKNCHEHHH